ncbi:UNVERIFIED_CONTAM: hypothetical protein HDU68_000211, partial [Siphonaria sp. JEL0065]
MGAVVPNPEPFIPSSPAKFKPGPSQPMNSFRTEKTAPATSSTINNSRTHSSTTSSRSGERNNQSNSVTPNTASTRFPSANIRENFPMISETLIKELLKGNGAIYPISLLNSSPDADIPKLLSEARTLASKDLFKNWFHLLECLLVYQTFLLFRIKHKASPDFLFILTRNFNAFVSSLVQAVRSKTPFSVLSNYAGKALKLSLRDEKFDFSQMPTIEVVTAPAALAAVVAHDSMDVEREEGEVVGFRTFLMDVVKNLTTASTPSKVSQLLNEKQVVELFQQDASSHPLLLEAVFKFLKKSTDVWRDVDYWALLKIIANFNND